jgi:hypothetical protein
MLPFEGRARLTSMATCPVSSFFSVPIPPKEVRPPDWLYVGEFDSDESGVVV